MPSPILGRQLQLQEAVGSKDDDSTQRRKQQKYQEDRNAKVRVSRESRKAKTQALLATNQYHSQLIQEAW